MTVISDAKSGTRHLLMGNQAMARGALEAGVNVAAGYPGTPSSEIIESLAGISAERNLYVEWSVNEKVAMEVTAAASFAGLRALCVMKQNGVNVASDFLLHLVITGTRGGMVLVACDDPGALSSANEGESRHFARLMEIPLLEPGDFQEAKDMVKWAFELSENHSQPGHGAQCDAVVPCQRQCYPRPTSPCGRSSRLRPWRTASRRRDGSHGLSTGGTPSTVCSRKNCKRSWRHLKHRLSITTRDRHPPTFCWSPGVSVSFTARKRFGYWAWATGSDC